MNAVYSPFQANKVKRLVYSKGTMYRITHVVFNPRRYEVFPRNDA